jgi:molybdopterin/thiamine biosynthesis adenylyltransferase
MTINQTIQIARGHGIGGAYARVMAGAIRSAASDRAVRAFRAAIDADNASHLFDGLNTSCPTAKVEK